MSRITRLKRSEVPADVQEIYERVGQARGNVPNMYRAFAHRPEILKTMVAHMTAVTQSGTVSIRTKELVATLVSRLNGCEY
jgi:alkylhydroperoxidase family enzyme